MDHPTIEEIFRVIDHTLTEEEKKQVDQHLIECQQCRNELKLYDSIGLMVKNKPLVKTSVNFTENLMRKIACEKKESWLYKTLSEKGYYLIILFMVIIFAYTLFNIDWKKQDSNYETSIYLKQISSNYSNTINNIFQQFNFLLKKTMGNTNVSFGNTFFIAILIIIIYMMLDKFVLRRFTRM